MLPQEPRFRRREIRKIWRQALQPGFCRAECARLRDAFNQVGKYGTRKVMHEPRQHKVARDFLLHDAFALDIPDEPTGDGVVEGYWHDLHFFPRDDESHFLWCPF